MLSLSDDELPHLPEAQDLPEAKASFGRFLVNSVYWTFSSIVLVWQKSFRAGILLLLSN
jgi:hypothetical protein